MFKGVPDKQKDLERFVSDRLGKANKSERTYMQMGFDLYLQVHNQAIAYLHSQELQPSFALGKHDESHLYREMTTINLFIASQTLRWGLTQTVLEKRPDALIEAEQRILDFMHEVFVADITLHFSTDPIPEEAQLQKRFKEYHSERESKKDAADGVLMMSYKMIGNLVGTEYSGDPLLTAVILDIFAHFKKVIPEMISHYDHYAKILSV